MRKRSRSNAGRFRGGGQFDEYTISITAAMMSDSELKTNALSGHDFASALCKEQLSRNFRSRHRHFDSGLLDCIRADHRSCRLSAYGRISEMSCWTSLP